MKIYRRAFICILIALLAVGPVLTINVMAEESDGSRLLDIGSKIEQYVDEHTDTTAGMGLCFQTAGMDQCNAACRAGDNRSGG